ncbi:matrix metalloproteinase [Euphorbia peplus]|nr:matrix metalloproteinase [Euphorbia peplus]
MASKAFPISSITIIFLLISLVCDTADSSAFDFLKQLQGHHKGSENIPGIQQLKLYLEQFGYLTYQNQSLANNDVFDDELESAIRTYQLNFHLDVTGVLDSGTVSMMMQPRCGVADIINGKTRMESGKKSHTSKLNIVSRFAFFPGIPRWPGNKYHLTYGFQLGTVPAAVEPVKRAFRIWQANSQFTFEITEYYDTADLRVNFYSGVHGDGVPFDGPGGTVGHGFPPPDGRLHFDADETWAVGAIPGAMDYETLALHEIGHLIGLAHSPVQDAIMYPLIPSGAVKQINEDDIQGIKALYPPF